ncbi:MAG: hypothetical protein WAQ27_01810 [Candidatus Microsaccharimonas sp.]
MLQPNPESPPPIFFSPPFELTPDLFERKPIDQYFVHPSRLREEQELEAATYSPLVEKLSRRERLKRKIGATSLVLATLFSQYVGNTNVNIEQERQAELSIEVVAPALDPEHSNTAILFFDGFNSNSAYYLSKELGPGLQAQIDGQIWAADFNNSLANREELLESTKELTKERGVTHLIVVGYSKGGINGNEVGVDTVTESWTNVDAIIMISTPSNYAGLQETQKKELEAGMMVSKVWRMRYFTPARYAGEVYFYRDKYTQGSFNGDLGHDAGVVVENIGNFFEVIDQINDRFNNPGITTMSFLIEQVDEIDKADFPSEYKKLSEDTETKQKPVIVYLGTKAPAKDYVVNDKLSGDTICDAAEENGLTCIRDEVEGAIHSQYYNTIDQYNESYARIGEELRQAIANEAAAVALKRSDFTREHVR